MGYIYINIRSSGGDIYKQYSISHSLVLYEVYIGDMGGYCIQYSITYNRGYYIKCSTMYSIRCI